VIISIKNAFNVSSKARFLPRLWIGLSLLLLLGLSGCGFKLRGQVTGDLQNKSVIVDGVNYYHPLATELRRRLQILGAEVVKLPKENLKDFHPEKSLYIYLNDPVQQQRTLSVDVDGRPLEYELSLQLDARIFTYGQDPSTIEPELMRVRRVLVYDKEQLLAKSREKQQMTVEMTRALIDQISERLRIYASANGL